MKTIVILGGSFAGVGTAHRLLKTTAKSVPLKVVLVSPNTHFYWNLAVTRAVVPGQMADDKLFQAIAPGFKNYSKGSFEFVLGSAESIDIEGKKVVVVKTDGHTVLDYDLLVLATGSKTNGDAPWKGRGTYEETRDALHDFQSQVKKAESIVIAGAGSTGVETSGELGFEYGKTKKITLIASGPQVLEGTPAKVQKVATGLLKSLNVTIQLSTKVQGSAKMPDGRTELTLSDGRKLITDLYLPTMGLLPNSSYIPAKFLNQNGFVVVDEYLRLKGAKDIWAVGDISSVQRPQLMHAEVQSASVAKNIDAQLKAKVLTPFKPGSSLTMAVPVGRSSGTGHMGNWKLPGIMVHLIKGKTYFTEKLPQYITGSAF